MKDLTRDEARERAELLHVTSYDVVLDVTGGEEGFDSTSTVVFGCRRPGAASFVEVDGELVSAELDGRPVGPLVGNRLQLPDLQAENRLVVRARFAYSRTGEGLHRFVDPADGRTYLWGMSFLDDAQRMFACFDQPDLKAPHRFTVTAPAAWTVVSNSGGAAVVDRGDTRTWTFPDTPPLSTYNPVVNAGPFHEIRREVDGYDLGLYARRTLASALERDSEQLFTLTAQGLAFFGERFGMPFPQRTYDQVFLPEFGGAMENYGCVTWADDIVRRHEPTTSEWQVFTNVLLHEMAHMWFGNIVTMRWWDDLWLNEAFADVACHWACERATRYTDA